MRLYQDPMEMIREVERDLFEMGVRYQSATVQDQNVADDPRFQTIELNGYAYALTGFTDEKMFEMLRYMNANVEWAESEALERISLGGDRNPGTAWKHDEARWRPFLRDGAFSYSYAERWGSQLPYVLRELTARPNTRQAMITMYDVHQDMMNWGGRDRVPCSISYQFVLRDGKLTLVYCQRSCDFMKFFATDVYLTVVLLRYVAKRLGVEPARLVHFLGSLHAFAGDLEGRNIF